jgi:aminopeptidase N
MEHQSAVAYGNKYKKGYMGRDLSGTGLGMDWDYIIIHESGHEWFGNNITSKDIADMWIHEAFTMYSEGLFVECAKGKEAGARYIAGVRQAISNDRPIIGPYDVNKEGSGDMYYKGANMLQTIRAVINDDTKWLEILRGMNKEFGLKTTTTAEIVDYFNKKSGINLTRIFDQYLRFASIPALELNDRPDGTLAYRWKSDVKCFDMPVQVKLNEKQPWEYLRPTTEWKTIKESNAQSLQVDTVNYYINISRNMQP